MAKSKVGNRNDPPRPGELRAGEVAKRLKCTHQNIYGCKLIELLQPRIALVRTYYFPIEAVEAVEAARAKAFAAGTKSVKGHWYEHLRRENDQIVADLPEADPAVSSDLLAAPQQVPDSTGMDATKILPLAGKAPVQKVRPRNANSARVAASVERVKSETVEKIDHHDLKCAEREADRAELSALKAKRAR